MSVMMKRNVLAVTLAVVAILVGGGLLLAQISPNFSLEWHTSSSGGGERSSANFIVQDSLGQSAAGASTSANFVVNAGFVAGIDGVTVANTTPTATPKPPEGIGAPMMPPYPEPPLPSPL